MCAQDLMKNQSKSVQKARQTLDKRNLTAVIFKVPHYPEFQADCPGRKDLIYNYPSAHSVKELNRNQGDNRHFL